VEEPAKSGFFHESQAMGIDTTKGRRERRAKAKAGLGLFAALRVTSSGKGATTNHRAGETSRGRRERRLRGAKG
jgi:hypothetical protein